MPSSSTSAVQIGLREHPAILSAQYNVDAAAFNVKSLEGSLLPSVSLNGSLGYTSTNTSSSSSNGALRNTDASISANVTVPIYQGGLVSAQVRQAKETMGQAQILVDSARREVEQTVVSYWADFEAAKASIAANQASVQASQLALKGVVEERKVGQSTQLDVLETQSGVLTNQENLAESQRNAVVASYALLSAMGRLTVHKLGLGVADYQPSKHYDAVKDKWFGLRTVDGR
jgi:outer membrane protein